jgi:hypothetical protein
MLLVPGPFGIVFSFANYPLLASGALLVTLLAIGNAERWRARVRKARDRARTRRLRTTE